MRKQILLFALLGATSFVAKAQDASVSSGDNATGNGGDASYSVGIAIYTSYAGDSGWVNQGVQQAYDEVLSSSVDPVVSGVDFKVYPNPTLSFVNLKTDDFKGGSYRYALLDVSGKEVMANQISETLTQVELHSLPSGIYFIKVWNQDQEIQSFKIFKHE